ncbi:MAG: hypothetical protein JWL73_813 [Actinomycetia bacterium]|nr:hypothetical protein [Actinomycetes bacterium]
MKPDRTFLVIRSIMLAITLGLALVLLATGHVLVGLLFVALAAARVAMFMTFRKRNAQLRERYQARIGARDRGGFGPGPTSAE